MPKGLTAYIISRRCKNGELSIVDSAYSQEELDEKISVYVKKFSMSEVARTFLIKEVKLEGDVNELTIETTVHDDGENK